MTKISYSDYLSLLEMKDENISEIDFNLTILSMFICTELYDKLVEQNICPECGDKLELKPHGYESYEYQGKDMKNKQYILSCVNCSMTYGQDE